MRPVLAEPPLLWQVRDAAHLRVVTDTMRARRRDGHGAPAPDAPPEVPSRAPTARLVPPAPPPTWPTVARPEPAQPGEKRPTIPGTRIGLEPRRLWKPELPRYVPGPGRLRKIALVGSAYTVEETPWDDPSWEIWAHAASRKFCRVDRVSRWFDLHPKETWTKKAWDPQYPLWLAANTIPIYMSHWFPEVPACRRYPKELVLNQFSGDAQPHPFTSQGAWMVALALLEGCTHLGVFGIHYEGTGEREHQRYGMIRLLAYAEGLGVRIIVPGRNPIFGKRLPLYGYESHQGGTLAPEYKAGASVPGQSSQLVIIDPSDPEAPRPPLRKDLLEPPAWERSGHPLPRVLPDGTLKEY